MTMLDHALRLAAKGFHVFPCEVNGKKPLIMDFPNVATRDATQIKRWFDNQHYNIGISTSRYGDSKALVVIDIDNKNGKSGDASILELEMQGLDLPSSMEQSTPSGGRHIIYSVAAACKQGVSVLGPGLDIRSRGGYIIGPGSVIDGVPYRQINGHDTVMDAPQWLPDRLGHGRIAAPQASVVIEGVDLGRAERRGIEFLSGLPPAPAGERNHLAFKAAAYLKDLGCDEPLAGSLMIAHFSCEPPAPAEDLLTITRNAYHYGQEPQGSRAPEAVFFPVENSNLDAPRSPLEEMNKEFAFVKVGCFVLQETTDKDGRFITQHLGMAEFHGWFANKTMTVGKKTKPLSQWWIEWAGRREHESVVFAPNKHVGPRWYNLWRGFTVEPTSAANPADHPAVKAWIEHVIYNACGGDKRLAHWLISYFAHMIQYPELKPLVALVIKGDKGSGKNALLERIGALLGIHFMVASNRRFLTGNFNSHMENMIFFVLDEAAWAGDKSAEGTLKDLITGKEHTIERKGKEPYRVDNLTRVAILGNEDWLVPATQDERRFAVFNMSNGRRRDNKFFEDMRVGMENGGYAYFLKYLMEYDISGVDLNTAPVTQGLMDQKHASLEPEKEWWFECLRANELLGDTFDGPMPHAIPTNRRYEAFLTWARKRNIRSRIPGKQKFNEVMRVISPSQTEPVKMTPEHSGDATRSFKNEGIERLRLDWETYIGGSMNWSD